MENTFRAAGISAGFVLSVFLTACSGTQDGIIPNDVNVHTQTRHTMCTVGGSTIACGTSHSGANGGNSGLCSSGNGLDCKNNTPVADPGPAPGEIACDPSAGDSCGTQAAWAGGPAKAGDPCWGSPGTIGAFVGNGHDAAHQIYNITQVVTDMGGGLYNQDGWIYATQSGAQYFQAYPGTSFGVSAGQIVTGGVSKDPNSAIVPISPLAENVFNILQGAISITVPGLPHTQSKPCFTKKWNGTAGA